MGVGVIGRQLETVLALLGLETFPFLLPVCLLASLCTLNNAFPVHTAVVIVLCTFFKFFVLLSHNLNTIH